MLEDKFSLITNGTSELGLEIACEFVKSDANVIILSKDKIIGKRFIKKVKNQTGKDSIELLVANTSKQEEIFTVTKQLKRKYDKLDILVNNEDWFYPELCVTEDGIEQTFASNYLSTFLITRECIPLLRNTSESKIINVCSYLHKGGYFNFKDINLYKNYNGMKAYKNSKLAIILFTYFLAKKLDNNNIKVNAVNPGRISFSKSDLHQIGSYMVKSNISYLTIRKAAEAILFLAKDKSIENVTGKYFTNNKVKRTKFITNNIGLQKKLWELSKQLTKIKRFF